MKKFGYTLPKVGVRIMPTSQAMWREVKVMNEALLGSLANTIAPMDSKKFGVEVAIVQGIAYAMGQIKVHTLVHILCDVQAEPLVNTLAYVVTELEALTLFAKLGYLELKAPVDTLADICRGLDCCLDT